MVFVNDLPEEVLVAMNDPHAVNLGIATSFAWWGPPTSSRWFHAGIDLIGTRLLLLWRL